MLDRNQHKGLEHYISKGMKQCLSYSQNTLQASLVPKFNERQEGYREGEGLLG